MGREDIRIGKVSSIDYKTGMMRVTYTDKGEAVTANMPYANFNGEYKMPRVGQNVVVAHLSNGSSRGIVLGPIWNKKNMPSESGKGLYRKDMSQKAGTAYQRYNEKNGRFEIVAPEIRITAAGKEELSARELTLNVNLTLDITAREMTIELEEGITAEIKNAVIQALEDIQIESEMGIMLKAIEDIQIESEMGIMLKALEEIQVETEQKAVLKAKSMELEDDSWKTSLSRIMDRLAALDGDSSDKK